MLKKPNTFFLTLALFCAPMPLLAVTIPVVNAGFEADVLGCAAGPTCFDAGVIPGWNTSRGGTTFKPSTGAGGEFPAGIPGGVNVGAVGNPTSFGEMTQDLGFSPAANTTYTLSVFVGSRTDAPITAYFIEILEGSNVVATTSSPTPGLGTFVLATVVYNSGSNPGLGHLTIGLAASGGGQADYDNVSLVAIPTVVPEPGTYLTFAFGILGIVSSRLRARRI